MACSFANSKISLDRFLIIYWPDVTQTCTLLLPISVLESVTAKVFMRLASVLQIGHLLRFFRGFHWFTDGCSVKFDTFVGNPLFIAGRPCIPPSLLLSLVHSIGRSLSLAWATR